MNEASLAMRALKDVGTLKKALQRLADPTGMAGMGNVNDPEGLQRMAFAREVLDHIFDEETPNIPRLSRNDPGGKVSQPYLMSVDALRALYEAGLLPDYPMVHRVVLDFKAGDIARMYVDRIPTGALMSILPLIADVNLQQEDASTDT